MFCSFIDFLTEPFVFVFLLLDLHPRETIRRVYAHFRKASDGCDGSTGFGFYGFLNVRSLFLIFQALGVRERKLVDLGAGDGKVLASAMRCNARSVVGYELPSNSAHKYIYDAVLRRIFPNPIQHNQIKPMAQWLAKDIDKVFFRRVIPRLSIFELKFLFRSMFFQTTRILSIHFGMVCPPKPKLAFSNYPPAANLSANSQCFATTTGVSPKKVNYTFLFFPVHAFFFIQCICDSGSTAESFPGSWV
jgi:hypothetical protein